MGVNQGQNPRVYAMDTNSLAPRRQQPLVESYGDLFEEIHTGEGSLPSSP